MKTPPYSCNISAYNNYYYFSAPLEGIICRLWPAQTCCAVVWLNMTLPATQFTHDFVTELYFILCYRVVFHSLLQSCVSFSRNLFNGIFKNIICVVTKIELPTSAGCLKSWMFRNCCNSVDVGCSTGPKSKTQYLLQYCSNL